MRSMTPEKYPAISIALHWLIGLSIIGMLIFGLLLDSFGADKALQFQLIQIHKSVGVLLLLAILLRIGMRLIFRAPPLPETLKPVERKAAHLGHWGLYALMLAMPLTGWLMVSASVYGLPTIVFGWFTWPHIPGIPQSKPIGDLAYEMHEIFGFILIGFIVLHLAAVVKHALIDKHNLLPRMGIGKVKKDMKDETL